MGLSSCWVSRRQAPWFFKKGFWNTQYTSLWYREGLVMCGPVHFSNSRGCSLARFLTQVFIKWFINWEASSFISSEGKKAARDRRERWDTHTGDGQPISWLAGRGGRLGRTWPGKGYQGWWVANGNREWIFKKNHLLVCGWNVNSAAIILCSDLWVRQTITQWQLPTPPTPHL